MQNRCSSAYVQLFRGRVATIVTLCVLVPLTVSAQEIPGWTLVWQDEFTQADGTSPDPVKWSYNIGRGDNGWGNAELQYYTSRTNNARIENNRLVIEAHEESYAGSDYTSARLLTQNKWSWTYGRMEARIKVPYGQGIWPAFWMLGADIGSVGWPNCGEIDIMEHIGREPQNVYGTIHGPGYSGGASYGDSISIGEDVSADFHVFAVEWEENLIRWYVDGTLYHTAVPADVAPGEWVFDHPFFFILNVAVGGYWPGYPDETTVFPQRMEVDYVRVYTPTTEPPPAGTNVLVNPGFETGTLNAWIGYSAGGANDLGTYVESTSDTYYNGGNPGGDNILTRSGTYAGKIYGDFTGVENYNGAYQDIPAEPESIWSADGWALTHVQDLMQSPNTSWIEVSFRDASDTILALYRSDVLEADNITVSGWMHLQVTNQLNTSTYLVTNTTSVLTAPAGTAKARYQLVFRQLGYDDGAVYYDDLNMIRHADVMPFPLHASVEGESFRISFPSRNGVSYDIFCKNSLTNTAWIPVETVVGNGSTNSVLYPATNACMFYQVMAP